MEEDAPVVGKGSTEGRFVASSKQLPTQAVQSKLPSTLSSSRLLLTVILCVSATQTVEAGSESNALQTCSLFSGPQLWHSCHFRLRRGQACALSGSMQWWLWILRKR